MNDPSDRHARRNAAVNWTPPGPGRTLASTPSRGDDPGGSSRTDVATGVPARTGAPTTVMIVEDYAPLRVLCTRLLRGAGYVSIAAASADDALSTLTNDAPPAIVVTDLNMPGEVTGQAFIDHLRTQHPDIGLVVITGDTTTGAITAGTGELVLTKPFANEALLDAVADVLAAKS